MEKVLKEVTALGKCLYVDRDGNVYRKIQSKMKPLPKYKRNGGYEYVEISTKSVGAIKWQRDLPVGIRD